MVTWKSARCVHVVNKLDNHGWKFVEYASDENMLFFKKKLEGPRYLLVSIIYDTDKKLWFFMADDYDIDTVKSTALVFEELATFSMLMAELRALKELEENGSNFLQSV